ncbi:DUF4136 domain-containing protein [Thalassotalea euphylliae]|uniref:DUF4136 domain-containing protein n=1 Tax=Thalassotalea euphylliae TaxID=1655234 RepID=A0A3E0TWL6_9GAMM|nr:DUF4136 domain-containing protein [Thalassotalea euphylliae]
MPPQLSVLGIGIRGALQFWAVSYKVSKLTNIYTGYMMKYCHLVLLLLVLLAAGCVQLNQAQTGAQVDKQTQLAISAVRDLPNSFAKGDAFTIVPTFVDSSVINTEQTAIYQAYGEAIASALQLAGYQQSANEQSDFTVVYGLALQQDLSDTAISENLGVLPGLSSAERLEKGSFLIYIEDSVTNQRIWRGAVQGFVHQDFSRAQREQRAVTIVNSVLSSFLNEK